MITLAVASFFAILASQLSDLTGGEDGLNFQVCPSCCARDAACSRQPLLGVDLNGRLSTYYLVFVASLALFLVLLRIVNSPFGRVLQAIRENEFRAEAIGYRTVDYRTVANCSARWAPTARRRAYALWLRYSGPEMTLSFDIMVDILLMVVIGGMGTMYGAAIGATIFVLAQNYLQDLMKLASEATPGIPLLPTCSIPTAGCCGSACCSSSASTTSRAASSATCGSAPRAAEPGSAMRVALKYLVCEGREIHYMEWSSSPEREYCLAFSRDS